MVAGSAIRQDVTLEAVENLGECGRLLGSTLREQVTHRLRGGADEWWCLLVGEVAHEHVNGSVARLTHLFG